MPFNRLPANIISDDIQILVHVVQDNTDQLHAMPSYQTRFKG
jgi:hypothetical protein